MRWCANASAPEGSCERECKLAALSFPELGGQMLLKSEAEYNTMNAHWAAQLQQQASVTAAAFAELEREVLLHKDARWQSMKNERMKMK